MGFTPSAFSTHIAVGRRIELAQSSGLGPRRGRGFNRCKCSHRGAWAAYFTHYKLYSTLEVCLDVWDAFRGGLSYLRAAEISRSCSLCGPGKTYRSTLEHHLLNTLPFRQFCEQFLSTG